MMAVGAGIKALVGGIQTAKGLSMKPERPTYDIPDEAQDALNNARRVASMTEIPGANILRDALRENMANSLFAVTQSATSPTQAIAAAGSMQETYANEEQKLAAAGANMYVQNQGLLRQELNRMADRKDQQFVINELNPYVEDMERKQALIGGGVQNIMGGVDMAGNAMVYKMQSDYLSQLMGGNKTVSGANNNFISSSTDAATGAAMGALNPTTPQYTVPTATETNSMMRNPFAMNFSSTPQMTEKEKFILNPFAPTPTVKPR